MSDEPKEPQDQQEPQDPPTTKTFTEDEVNELINGLKQKNEELLGEKKTAAQRARELEEAQEASQRERMQEKEQFRELYEREQKSKQELAEKFEDFQDRIRRQEIAADASKLANELTRDSARGELLQEKASAFAKHTEDGVVYELGGVQVERDKVVEHLREKYPFLIDGTGATGGGAAGNNNGGAVTKAFNEMSGAELSDLRAKDPATYERIRNEFYQQ